MAYAELTPRELLAPGFAAPEVTGRAWRVRWDRAPGIGAGELPDVVDFHTSGTTGPRRKWRRYGPRMWDEAGMLAELVAPGRPDAALSFVPPAHLFGALATVLVPARLGVPAWYRDGFFGTMPDVGARPVVMATPWIFELLLRHLDWARGLDHLTVLYSGAMLPATAGDLLRELGPDRVLLVEVLGSTEAGGVATRAWREGEPPAWQLFPDVEFAGPVTVGAETPLAVTSPRLAFRPGEPVPGSWEADDRVVPLGARSFRHAGRAGRLVKVNGRRINLDAAEYTLRAVLDCADLALLPVTDPKIGEHVELLVALAPGTEVADLDLAAAFARLGVRPRRLHVVPRIDRSALGKLRHVPIPTTPDEEVTAR
ncbi:class I adenylate-forming enzyme family protein [Amycolatopsis samaneae]|uniref:Long-chain fatty acid--CoA ligase n=1 Tax=Amycolatopsis samaneae TaxID=664691 RepID=A0ABW5GFC7_9PSEU